MIDGNVLRAEYARYLHEHTHTRWGLDAALMHVCKMAYEQGLKDGLQVSQQSNNQGEVSVKHSTVRLAEERHESVNENHA